MWTTVIVDDEIASLNYLSHLCQEIEQIQLVQTFTNPRMALDFLLQEAVDLVFLDIEMPELSGIDIARQLQQTGQKTLVVFMTGYEQYALAAYQVEAIGYLLKPGRQEEIQKLLLRLEALRQVGAPVVYIQTMDHFDVFYNHQPIYFKNTKAKELLAVLVDHRGSIVTMDQMIDILWENRPYDEKVKQLYRKSVNYLNKLLESYGMDFFVSNRGSCFIKKDRLSCDLYELFEGKAEAMEKYHGKYMFEYSWSEFTTEKIERFLDKNHVSWADFDA